MMSVGALDMAAVLGRGIVDVCDVREVVEVVSKEPRRRALGSGREVVDCGASVSGLGVSGGAKGSRWCL